MTKRIRSRGGAGAGPGDGPSRGSALFMVLAVVAIASMLGAVVMTAGDSTATATDRQVERIELRATAWCSGESRHTRPWPSRPALASVPSRRAITHQT